MLNFLFFFSFSALVVVSVPLWRNVLKHKLATGSLMPTREHAGSPLGFLDVIVMFFFWLVGQAASIGLVTLIFGIRIEELASAPGNTMSFATILMAAGQLVATFLAIGVFLIRYRTPSVVGWQPKSIGGDLVLGLFAFAMVIPGILFLQWLLVLVFAYQHPTMELLAKNANGLTLLATWFSAVIVAPICEEFFFRGVLQSWLQRLGRGTSDHVLTGGWDSDSNLTGEAISKSPTASKPTIATAVNVSNNPYQSPGAVGTSRTSDTLWPILVTSTLFALAHAGQGPAPIPLFVFGIALGYLFRRTGSIVPCIVLHMMLNAFSMFWFTLNVFFGDPETVAMLERVQASVHLF